MIARNSHVSLQESPLWTLEEITRLISESGKPSETLTNIVRLIRRRFETDVCSVYLLEPDRTTLVLAATIGLRPESVGCIRMRLTEGLAGLVAERLQPEVVADAARHPRFKYFSEAGEDSYRSFLGVPLVDRGILQGVLVVQTKEPREFSQDDVRMLVTSGMQLAPIVAEARALGQLIAPAHERLSALSQNLWWSWDNEATSLFREIDPVLWRELGHNCAPPRGPVRRGARCSAEFVAQAGRALSFDALTIGFARRFATYKRANLILEEWKRSCRS